MIIAGMLIIATLAGLSAGIFAWLALQRFYDQLVRFQQSMTQDTAERFSDMFLFIDIRKYLSLYVGITLILPLLLWLLLHSILAALLLFVVLLAAPHLLLRHLWQRRLRRFTLQLPDALSMLAASMRAGSSLPQAMESLVRESEPPLSQEFSLFIRARKLGTDRETAMAQMEARLGLEELSLTLAAIHISNEVGGDLASTLENLAETLRQKLTMEGKIRSLTAQGKLQGLVMSVLPMFLMLALLKLEPKAMRLMFTTSLGWATLGLILALQVLGFLSIKKITTIDV